MKSCFDNNLEYVSELSVGCWVLDIGHLYQYNLGRQLVARHVVCFIVS